jgi:2-polyprenyl-3-methyl-5-hydroxy-6-metoxy-1,4-benzoquinol methylase
LQLTHSDKCPISGVPGPVVYPMARDAFFDTPGNWTYRRDVRSGHLWLDPRPIDECIGELYSAYYTHEGASRDKGDLWMRAMGLALARSLGYPNTLKSDWGARLVARLPTVTAAAELEVMRVPATERGRLLDYGCGSGAFLERMKLAGWQAYGIEPDESAAARLSAREGICVFSSIEDLLARDIDTFDVITLSHVIEHVPNPIATLASLRRLLRRSGRLIITTPNAASLGSRIFGSAWRGLEPPRHLNVFTRRSLCEALLSTGLTPTRTITDVRLARGIWFLSVLSRQGYSSLETARRTEKKMLKLGGYIFQLVEAALSLLNPDFGEEIFCTAIVAPDR